jgi:hypothetical protein
MGHNHVTITVTVFFFFMFFLLVFRVSLKKPALMEEQRWFLINILLNQCRFGDKHYSM